MERFMDVEKAGAYWAVDRALNLVDGPARYRRSSELSYYAKNFYLYESNDRAPEHPDRFTIIP